MGGKVLLPGDHGLLVVAALLAGGTVDGLVVGVHVLPALLDARLRGWKREFSVSDFQREYQEQIDSFDPVCLRYFSAKFVFVPLQMILPEYVNAMWSSG